METETLPYLNASNFGNKALHSSFYNASETEMVGNYTNFSMETISNKPTYTIVPITEKDVERVVNFLRKFFFRDEPLNVAVGLLDEPNSTCRELEEYCVDCVPEGLSIMAVSTTGYLLGVCLNGALTKESDENENSKESDIEACVNPKFKKILRLLTTITKQSDVFGQFPTAEKILDIRILSVDESCRGQGICKALINKTLEMAKEGNYSLMKVDCSSHYSAKAVARLDFQCIYTLEYEDYVDEQGQRIFNTKLPHTSAKTYVMPLTI